MRCPIAFLALGVRHRDGDVTVLPTVGRCESEHFHRCRIDKELEGGTRLSHGCHLVVFPCIEIDVAHPCSHKAGLWFHRHKSAVHLANHVADGVHRTDFALHRTVGSIVGEKLHGVRLIHVEVNGIRLIRVFLFKNLVIG